MMIGFWNIYRKTSYANSMGEYTVDFIKQWMKDTPLDVLVLAEVERDYRPFIAHMRKSWPTYGIEYVPCANSVGAAGPCSFIYLISNMGWRVEPVGNGTQRPILMITTPHLVVAAVHIIANSDEAPDEILTACDELIAREQPGLLVGDMNYPFGDLPRFDQQGLVDRGFARVDPGMGQTFKGGQVLDYAFRGATVGNIEPKPPAPLYDDWVNVDHAPIAYQVT